MDEFGEQPLHTVDDSADMLEKSGRIESYQQTVECLGILVKLKELVMWIKDEIKGKDTALSAYLH